MSATEAAQLLGVSLASVSRYVLRGVLTPVRGGGTGRPYLLRADEVQALAAALHDRRVIEAKLSGIRPILETTALYEGAGR